MKILLSLLLAISFACCKNKTMHHQPEADAKYSITIEIQATGRMPATEEKEEVFQLLKANAESSGIICQSIEMVPENQRITFNVVGLLSEGGIKDPGLDFIVSALGGSSSLEFWDVYQNTDENIAGLFFQLYQQYDLGKLLTPGFSFPGFVPSYSTAVIGTVAPEDIRPLDSILKMPVVLNSLPPEMVLAWSFYQVILPEEEPYFELYALKKSTSTGPFLTGKDLLAIQGSMEEGSESVSIDLEFNNEAALAWADKTRWAAENSNREIAILMDGWVLTAPKVMSEITSGICPITTGYGLEESSRIINKLKLGALPYNLKVVEAKKL